MPTPILAWTADAPGAATATTGGAKGRAPVFLRAAPGPGGNWDWSAWTDRGGRGSLRGTASDQAVAMKKAEAAARALLVVQAIEAA